ncbi:hypothetical protein X949_4380 [Burkholderia pseudomallei MSHR5609]|nr:hypothetical protein X949_4380 [Burkholderia pseudomallei MSHR5609]
MRPLNPLHCFASRGRFLNSASSVIVSTMGFVSPVSLSTTEKYSELGIVFLADSSHSIAFRTVLFPALLGPMRKVASPKSNCADWIRL